MSRPCRQCKNPVTEPARDFCSFCRRLHGGPVEARTLEDAAKNPDGTWNGFKAMSWMSEALNPGRGFTPEEVEAIWDDVKARKEASK